MNLKNTVLMLALVAFVGFVGTSFADDTQVAGKKSLESRIAELEAKLKDAGAGGGVKGSGIKISGYVDTSYTLNLADRNQTGPVAGSTAQNTGRVFDNQYDAFNLNAVKLTIEKSKDNSKFPAGFRVDGILGEDANVLRNRNNAGLAGSDSTLFLEQAYVNLGIPVGNGIDVKVGKMVSLIGYEAIESVANWQFSRSDAFRISPWTQTGVTLGYKWNDTVTTTVGVVNGAEDSVAGLGSGNLNTELGFVGRVDVTGPKTSFGDFNAFVAGMYDNDNVLVNGGPAVNQPLNDANNYLLNIGGTWAKPFGAKSLALGIDWLYRYSEAQANAFAVNQATQFVPLDASVLSAYGKWDWAKWTSTSGRFSWSQYNNNMAQNGVGQNMTLSPLVLNPAAANYTKNNDLYSFTLTQAFNVWKDTLVRLEWRHDWTDSGQAAGFGQGVGGVLTNDIRQDQDTIAVNVVYSF